jgi:hypothetical protein
MSTGEEGPDKSRRDPTDKAGLWAGANAALRRMLDGISPAIATMRGNAALRRMLDGIAAARRKASSSSLITRMEARITRVEARIPPEWQRPRRLILIGALVLAVVLIIVTRPTAIQRHPAPGTTVFQVGNRVVLRFLHSTGSVHVSPGPAGQVSIKENRNGFTDAIHTRYRQQGDAITVTVSIENGLPFATWVDFDVAVPQDTSTNVAVAAGTLEASHLDGNFVLQDSNGSIGAANVSGAIALHTTSGSISASHVSGQVSAITDNGTITTSSTHLGGHSLLRAQNGTINFHGSLNPGSHAVFRNTNGTTAITLPSRSSVLVAARTPHGSINSEFSSVRAGTSSDGRVADGRVGRGAPAHLSIQTTAGSISLNRAP